MGTSGGPDQATDALSAARAKPGGTGEMSRRFAPVFGVAGLKWWARGDSNARPLPCQGSALTN